MDGADPGLGRELRKQYADVIPVFQSDKYVKLTPAEKDTITGSIQDMVTLIRRERIPLTAATSVDEYEWVLRQALNAAQDDAFLRSLPLDPILLFKSPEQVKGERWEHNEEMRELAMADNLRWVQRRESSRGRVLFFAHDAHLQTNTQVFVRPMTTRIRSAGMYLRSALGGDMVVIGTYFGRGASFPAESAPVPPDTAGMDSLLSSLSLPSFTMDLRELPSAGILHDWFQAAHKTRAGRGATTMVAPLEAYDAILFIDTITPTPSPPKP